MRANKMIKKTTKHLFPDSSDKIDKNITYELIQEKLGGHISETTPLDN